MVPDRYEPLELISLSTIIRFRKGTENTAKYESTKKLEKGGMIREVVDVALPRNP